MIYQFKVRLVDLGLRANSNLLKKTKKIHNKGFPLLIHDYRRPLPDW